MSVETILWSAIGGLILIMLSIIGYLIDRGFSGIKEQLRAIWDKVDAHQSQAEENAKQIAAIEARCEERHKRSAA